MAKIKKSELQVIFLILFGINFFSFNLFNTDLVVALHKIGGVIIFLYFIFNIKGLFKKENSIFIYFSIALILSSIYSWKYWSQSFWISFTGLFGLFYFYFYFYLKRKKINPYKILEIVEYIGWFYALFYLINILFNFPIFGYGSSQKVYGFIKYRFDGRIFMYLSFLIATYRVIKIYSTNNLLKFLFISCVFLIMGRRIMLVSLAFSFLYLYFAVNNVGIIRIFKIVIYSSFIFILVFNIFDSMFGLIFKSTEGQIEEGTDYVRFQSLFYYLYEFPKNKWGFFFGNGYPSTRSLYGMKVERLEDSRGFFLADIGIIGFVVKYGVTMIITYLLILKKLWKTQSLVLRSFVIFYLPMSLMNVEFYKDESLMLLSILIYASFCKVSDDKLIRFKKG